MALIFVVWVEGERDKESEKECVCARVCSVHQYQCLPELGKYIPGSV